MRDFDGNTKSAICSLVMHASGIFFPSIALLLMKSYFMIITTLSVSSTILSIS